MSQARVRVKLCGFTREADICDGVRLGADAIGLVLYEKSKRYVDIDAATRLRQKVPAFVSCVALFVNPEADYVRQVLQQVQPDLLQFHGDETPDSCDAFNHPYIKAFRVGGPSTSTSEQVLAQCLPYRQAKGWLFDSYSPDYGGTGVRFDINLLRDVLEHSRQSGQAIILAGGLTEANVAEAIRATGVFAVDVSSGIESAPGQKNEEQMQRFIHAVQQAG